MPEGARGPGRTCPASYGYAPESFGSLAAIPADTLYVVGGLYGNAFALDAILAMAAAERHPVTLCFNGDFHWFDATPEAFEAINRRVLEHPALRGKIGRAHV